jgi:hypothetical protein
VADTSDRDDGSAAHGGGVEFAAQPGDGELDPAPAPGAGEFPRGNAQEDPVPRPCGRRRRHSLPVLKAFSSMGQVERVFYRVGAEEEDLDAQASFATGLDRVLDAVAAKLSPPPT